MKNKLSIVGIALVILGAVIGAVFGNYTAVQITSFAVTMFGAGLAVAGFYADRKEGTKKWVGITTTILVGGGAFICGILQMITEDTMVQIIGYAVALALLIAGIVTNVFASKK